ncbi:MAG: hypothetical protein EXQ92_02760 [Alphaproteobacteria bacterium]|nr:hypothetical protein [Alphaproteobacteria bacterium]
MLALLLASAVLLAAPAALAQATEGLQTAQITAAPARAPKVSTTKKQAQAVQFDRRRPGVQPPRPEDALAPADPNAIRPPEPAQPYEIVPVPDRWRIVEAIGVRERLIDPYNQNTLKGDRPIFGDYFVVLSAISDTIYEPRSFPVPVGLQTTLRPDSNSTFGRVRNDLFAENLILSASLIKGDTAFKPPDFELRFTPVINVNRAWADEVRILHADPRKGDTRRASHFGVQEMFADVHLRNVSDRYDFDSTRAGIQPFSSDFRGFLFQDNQLGLRLFGSRANNRFQYNLAAFRRLEKDTNSGLNALDQPVRDDEVYLANLYVQDFPVLGFTSQATVIHNRNREAGRDHYDKNGFIVRPASIGDERGREYDVTYLGLNGDGHFGRFNLTASAYFAHGIDRNNTFTSEPADIRAFFAAIEPSVDFDWIRVRLSGLYASGDRNPFDNRQTGFDAIFENPQFAGADTSYWIRQSIPLIGGGGVALSPRNGVLPSLRSSKEEGQSNFVNPGLRLVGIGTDLDLTPELRLSTNFNYLKFDNTSSLQVLRNQGSIRREIGYDLSAALTYRPLFIQNVVLRLSGAVLLPGPGMRDLYDSTPSRDYYYSVLTNLILTY